jgi:predicted nucleic acid-binding protein
LTRLKRRQILNEKQILAAYNDFKKIPLRLLDVDIENALEIACEYSIYAYDAYYLEPACRLRLPLFTLDVMMKKIAKNLNLRIMGEKRENI